MTVVTGGKLNQTDQTQPGQSSDLATREGRAVRTQEHAYLFVLHFSL